jgi:thiol:disulfide interchange protein DsbA
MIFEQIHRNGNLLDTEAALAALFTRFGVDAATFSRTFRSPAVQLQLRRAEELNRAYRVSATPALVIHGSYLTTPALAGSPAALLAIADELLDERPRRCTARTGCDPSEPAKPIF